MQEETYKFKQNYFFFLPVVLILPLFLFIARGTFFWIFGLILTPLILIFTLAYLFFTAKTVSVDSKGFSIVSRFSKKHINFDELLSMSLSPGFNQGFMVYEFATMTGNFSLPMVSDRKKFESFVETRAGLVLTEMPFIKYFTYPVMKRWKKSNSSYVPTGLHDLLAEPFYIKSLSDKKVLIGFLFFLIMITIMLLTANGII